jgi:hypothetical protein
MLLLLVLTCTLALVINARSCTMVELYNLATIAELLISLHQLRVVSIMHTL